MGYLAEKKFDDICSRLDIIHEYTGRRLVPRYAYMGGAVKTVHSIAANHSSAVWTDSEKLCAALIRRAVAVVVRRDIDCWS